MKILNEVGKKRWNLLCKKTEFSDNSAVCDFDGLNAKDFDLFYINGWEIKAAIHPCMGTYLFIFQKIKKR